MTTCCSRRGHCTALLIVAYFTTESMKMKKRIVIISMCSFYRFWMFFWSTNLSLPLMILLDILETCKKKKRGCNSLPLRCQDIWKEVKPSNDSVYGIFTQAFLCRYENLFVSGSLFIKIKKLFSYILFLKLNWLALHPLNLHSHNPREMRSLIYFWE